MERGDSNEYPQHIFLWRTDENYPSIIIKYPPYSTVYYLGIAVKTKSRDNFDEEKQYSMWLKKRLSNFKVSWHMQSYYKFLHFKSCLFWDLLYQRQMSELGVPKWNWLPFIYKNKYLMSTIYTCDLQFTCSVKQIRRVSEDNLGIIFVISS